MCINESELDQFTTLKKDIDDDEITKDSVNSIVKSIFLNRGRFGGVIGKAVFFKYFLLSMFKCLLKKDRQTIR